MATISRESIVERRQPQLRWSAVLGGSAVAVGLWILLQVFGLGVGFAAIDTDDAGSLRGAGLGAGVWSLIAPLLAIFGGALITGRIATTYDRGLAAIHGVVTWAIATIAGTWMLVTIVSMLASGAARIGGAAAGAASNVVQGTVAAGAQIDPGQAMSTLGIDANDLLGPVNQRLRRDGKPEVTAPQLQAAVRGIAQRGLRQGRLDRQVVVSEVARNTALSRADAEQVADDFMRRYDNLSSDVRARFQQLGQDAEHAALRAGDSLGKVLLLGGVMMVLSLAAAIGGALIGAYPRRSRHATPPAIPQTPPPPRRDTERGIAAP